MYDLILTCFSFFEITTTGILPVDDRINRIQQLSGDKMVISESGYMEIFVNNEAQTPVFFDNITVNHSTGPVMEVNAYYPRSA